MASTNWNKGSEWHRWDPHIHTPATLLNNQFKKDAWESYLAAVEAATPTVKALGITDYCVLRGYLRFLEYWKAGRASSVAFVFPNVEFRLSVETKAGKGINVHLLFSPDDADHVEQIERLLSALKFSYKGTEYPCTPDWLIKLGRALNPQLADDDAALSHGADQFKLDWNTLTALIARDAWARDNCLIAVSAHESDGFSGLKHDGSFEALREELKAHPHIIFSSTPSDREFWLGQKAGFDIAFIEATYGGIKPCLHGSDAHKLDEVLRPRGDRYCWIRAELSFTGLKQTLIEPELRVAVGREPPPGPSPAECIRSLELTDAPWFEASTIELNDGLVAIIGPKGSGKTALADVIARAAGAPIQGDSSFLLKAKAHLGPAAGKLLWADDTVSEARLGDPANEDTRPFVRYLSQQFVDRLCSSDDLGKELLEQIESVVFQSIPDEDRLGTGSFAELRDLRLEQVRRMRDEHLGTIQSLTQAIALEDQNKARLPLQQKKLADLKERVVKEENAVQALLPKDKKAEAARLAAVTSALEKKTRDIQVLTLRATKQQEFVLDYDRLRRAVAAKFDELKERYKTCGVQAEEWDALAPAFIDEADAALAFAAVKARIDKAIALVWDGTGNKVDADYSTYPLKELQARQTQLSASIGIEKERAKKHAELVRRLALTKQARDAAQKDIEYLGGVDTRRKKGLEGRRQAYSAVFTTLVREHELLDELYAPLKAQLASEPDVERRLELRVRRRIDIDAWVEAGESLIDLRRAGSFQGRGALATLAAAKLLPAWEFGGGDEVATAMEDFINQHMLNFAAAKKHEVPLQELGRWLFSTDHVSLEYSLQYEGVDLSLLSPGMRGIVLLMLYLAIDRWDTRPLVVDQPEENLDPHSVYEELVRYFKAAKRRRQVVVVTHNPNLVVNADADQVIVATAERTDSKSLPTIKYSSGGLEDKATRAEVCRILEGGERAFLDRDRRYAIPRDKRR